MAERDTRDAVDGAGGLEAVRVDEHQFARREEAFTAEGPVKVGEPETTRKTLGESGEDAFFPAVHVRPNAIVAHQEEGIEVVHLFGGRTLCKMLLTPLDAHADVNGDGVLEHVSARGGGGARLTAAGERPGRVWVKMEKNEKEKASRDRAWWARVSAGASRRAEWCSRAPSAGGAWASAGTRAATRCRRRCRGGSRRVAWRRVARRVAPTARRSRRVSRVAVRETRTENRVRRTDANGPSRDSTR